MSVCIAFLFFLLTPGILLRLPKGGSKMMVAATHAVLFALVFHLVQTMVWKGMEGFSSSSAPTANQAAGALSTGGTAKQAAAALSTKAGNTGNAPAKVNLNKKK